MIYDYSYYSSCLVQDLSCVYYAYAYYGYGGSSRISVMRIIAWNCGCGHVGGHQFGSL